MFSNKASRDNDLDYEWDLYVHMPTDFHFAQYCDTDMPSGLATDV